MKIIPRKPERLSRILDVAGRMFARHGYHAASTKEIARVAGLSENTLFRYFKHKEDLFWAALDASLSGLKLPKELLDGLARCEGPEIVLRQLITQFVDTATLNPEILRLVSVAFIELDWRASALCRQRLSPAFSVITAYFAVSIERGRLRRFDPALISTVIGMGVLAHFEFAKFASNAPLLGSNSRVIESHSKFWLDVLIPGASSNEVVGT